MTGLIDHNARCDVKWVDGKPTWKRSIRENGTVRICGNCMDKIDPFLPMMAWPDSPVEKSDSLDDDVDDA